MNFLAVKGFSTFQHYRDRNPPWIKLYGTLLVDAAFLQLAEAAQAQLMKLWILASQLGHPLPNNPKLLAGKIGTTGRFHLAALIASGFLIPCEDASAALAESEQDDSPPVRARNQSSELEDLEKKDVAVEPVVDALNLTVWANRAVTERWGEQPNPFTIGGSAELADELSKRSIVWTVVRESVYRQCRESKQPRPPRGVNYFRRGIDEDWQRHLARRAVEHSGEQPPPPQTASADVPRRPREEHWSDKKSREERETSERAMAGQRWGNVESYRNGRPDGVAWWARMQREAKAMGKNAVLYAYDRMNEPAEVNRVHV